MFTDFMADEDGNAQPAPEGHPASTEVRVELERDGAGTRMVMTHVGIPADSPGAAGWSAAFDKLEHALSQTSG